MEFPLLAVMCINETRFSDLIIRFHAQTFHFTDFALTLKEVDVKSTIKI